MVRADFRRTVLLSWRARHRFIPRLGDQNPCLASPVSYRSELPHRPRHDRFSSTRLGINPRLSKLLLRGGKLLLNSRHLRLSLLPVFDEGLCCFLLLLALRQQLRMACFELNYFLAKLGLDGRGGAREVSGAPAS